MKEEFKSISIGLLKISSSVIKALHLLPILITITDPLI